MCRKCESYFIFGETPEEALENWNRFASTGSLVGLENLCRKAPSVSDEFKRGVESAIKAVQAIPRPYVVDRELVTEAIQEVFLTGGVK